MLESGADSRIGGEGRRTEERVKLYEKLAGDIEDLIRRGHARSDCLEVGFGHHDFGFQVAKTLSIFG